jgi:lipopolysaccharide transport system ATP-binding protein
MTIAISVENVSKSYRLGTIGGGTLAGDLNRWWARLRGQPDPLLKVGQEDYGNRHDELIWALREVSFRVSQGDAVGIIGRNGAGKSTLLKILSRVTAPTSGLIKANGRVASLLEVGTGFHPELTGRENIYLNGAILGMSRSEVQRKFDEIVDFSDIEQFIDTPVKRYSSGMYVRLAFAVAAHLEPEILVVDEVLAVGDAEFQKKCLGKMDDVTRKNGRTVLFVSHNMSAVTGLCQSAVLLDKGRVLEIGNAVETVSK